MDPKDLVRNTESNEVPLPPIRTFEADIAESMREKQTSVIHIALAEQEKEREHSVYEKKAQGRTWLYITSLLFFIVSIATIFFVFFQTSDTSQIAVTPITQITSPLVRTDEQKTILVDVLNRDNIVASIASTSSISSVLNVYTNILLYTEDKTTEKIIRQAMPLASFLANVFPNAPEVLKRSLREEFAIVARGLTGMPLAFVFQAEDYERTVVGLNSWERTMVADFAPLFRYSTRIDVPEQFEVEEDVLATTTIATTTRVRGKTVTINKDVLATTTIIKIETRTRRIQDIITFESAIRKNVEIKSALGNSGTTYFVYGFPKRDVLIITKDVDTFFEIAERLRE